MKKVCILIMLLLPLWLGAQEKAAYRITYDCDALRDNKARKTYRWYLDIGERTAVFYNSANRQYLQESEALQHSKDVMAGIAGLQQLWAKYPNRSSLQVLIGKPKPGKYTYMNSIGADDLKYEESVPQPDWMLTDSRRPGCMAAHGRCGIVRSFLCPTARMCWADCRDLFWRRWMRTAFSTSRR